MNLPRTALGKWLWLALSVIVADQWTKFLITSNFSEFDSITLLPILDFMRLHNEGAAFSLLSDASGWQRWVFTILGSAVSIFIFLWLRRLPVRGQHMLAAALTLIMGGALGNVIDRILWGHVIDFIRVHYQQWYFPAFNIADSAITVGAALLILDTLLYRDQPADSRKQPSKKKVTKKKGSQKKTSKKKSPKKKSPKKKTV
ncbi:MAG: signal peptidase II [Pseudomonadota bacterium]|nr:signal peptidase II [Pseudomonadota bacterium]